MSYPILDTINGIKDLKALDEKQLPALCDEIRAFLIEHVSKTGGHLASSLGAVDLIVAMHYVFDSPDDKLIFDVGHQAYAHKILTGRKNAFDTLRQENGISGFPKFSESEHDVFNTGHASTAISAALGLARAMRLNGDPHMAVALVGDGAMTGGLSFEALNDAGQDKLPLLIILNDNQMSISKNVGGLKNSLTSMRTNRSYNAFKRSLTGVLETSQFGKYLSRHMEQFKNRAKRFLAPNLPFEEFGILYLGPIDGHNVRKVVKYLRRCRELKKPMILHAITTKGKGYPFAVDNPEKFHGIAPFEVMTGKVSPERQKTCSEIFGETMLRLAKDNEKLIAITAAMPSGTGLTQFAETYPKRFFDVGIAEAHAVTMAAGLARGGMRPVVALYSSFLQRGFDSLLHDVCLQNLPVVIAVDRAGLVGADGETHQGIFDPAFLSVMPNLVVYSPSSQSEMVAMLEMAVSRKEPSVVRYPRGSLPDVPMKTNPVFGQWEIVEPMQKTVIVAHGTLLPLAHWIAKKNGTGLVNARFLQPIDQELIRYFRDNDTRLLVLEENTVSLGAKLALAANPCRVRSIALPAEPITHASVSRQREWYGLTEESVTEELKTLTEEA
ncbi:MAG: 1-deoxy-D-xylulose-5-phosphate synthase [Clostridia bacterium]|nr:1-deoxy-D-xylulose-5-phosphate synthase [Clostridia bacterium]